MGLCKEVFRWQLWNGLWNLQESHLALNVYKSPYHFIITGQGFELMGWHWSKLCIVQSYLNTSWASLTLSPVSWRPVHAHQGEERTLGLTLGIHCTFSIRCIIVLLLTFHTITSNFNFWVSSWNPFLGKQMRSHSPFSPLTVPLSPRRSSNN